MEELLRLEQIARVTDELELVRASQLRGIDERDKLASVVWEMDWLGELHRLLHEEPTC